MSTTCTPGLLDSLRGGFALTAVLLAGCSWPAVVRWPEPLPLEKQPARQPSDTRVDEAIRLAETGDSSGADQLAAAVGDPHEDLTLRVAAAEALGHLDDRSAEKHLDELLESFGCDQPGSGAYLAELHAELLRSLGRHVDPAGDGRFAEALHARSAEVRLAAIEPWTRRECGPLPIEAIQRRADPDPRMRVAILEALARQRHPKAREYLAAALDDHEPRVRRAAEAALESLSADRPAGSKRKGSAEE